MNEGSKAFICDVCKANIWKFHRGYRGPLTCQAVFWGDCSLLIYALLDTAVFTLFHTFRDVPSLIKEHSWWMQNISSKLSKQLTQFSTAWEDTEGGIPGILRLSGCAWNGSVWAPCFRKTRNWSFSRGGSPVWFLFELLHSVKSD